VATAVAIVQCSRAMASENTAVADAPAQSLRLTLVPPKGGSHLEFAVDSSATGKELKLRVQELVGIDPESQLLFFQNGCRNAAKVTLDDSSTLDVQGIEDAATVTVRVNQASVQPEASVLRQSIAKNGGSSYYYAHANEKELPLEHRYVYGGAPAKLIDAEATGEDAGQLAATSARTIDRYSWADEGAFVCIYISAEAEQDAVQAARDGQGGEVKAEFGPKSVELRINDTSKEFALILRNLEDEIIPEDSKHRVSSGKRVTLKLKKKRIEKWMRLVKPQR